MITDSKNNLNLKEQEDYYEYIMLNLIYNSLEDLNRYSVKGWRVAHIIIDEANNKYFLLERKYKLV